MIEKVTHLNELFDIYSQLLTEKQKRIFELYYHEDLSLGEIAEEEGISRQAVYDTLKRVSKQLEVYEKELRIQSQRRENYIIIKEIEKALKENELLKIQELINVLKENTR